MSAVGFSVGFSAGSSLGALAAADVPGVHYGTVAQLVIVCGGQKRFTELFDADNDGVADFDFVELALSTADTEIDQYAAKRFHVPFSPVTSTIANKAVEIARLQAERWRGVYHDEHASRWDAIYSADKFKPGWLLQLAGGMVTPGSDPMPLKHTTMAVDQAIEGLPADRENSRRKMEGFW